jgi:hypothetical protein
MVSFFILLIHLFSVNLLAIKFNKNRLIQLKAAPFIKVIIYNIYYILIKNCLKLNII